MNNLHAFSPSTSLLLSLFNGSSSPNHLKNFRVVGVTKTPFAPRRLKGFVPTNMDNLDWIEVPDLPAKVRVCFGVYHSEQPFYKEVPGTTGLVQDSDGAEGLLSTKVVRGTAIIGALPPPNPYSQDYLIIEADDFITAFHPSITAFKPLAPSAFNPDTYDALSMADRIAVTRLAPNLFEPLLHLIPISRTAMFRLAITSPTGSVPTHTIPQFGTGVHLSFGGGASSSDVKVTSESDNRLALSVCWLQFPTLPASPNVSIFGYDLQPIDDDDKIFNLTPSVQAFIPGTGSMYKGFMMTGMKNVGDPLPTWYLLRSFIIFAVKGPGRLILPNGYVDYTPTVDVL